jgi:putative drug exporter of the RND superfamily
VARLFVKLRVIVVAAWIGGAVLAGMKLPAIGSSGGGSLAALVPKNAAALRAEQLSARRFGFPLLSRTVVVVRNSHGLSTRRQRQLVWLAERLTPGRIPGFGGIAAAIPIVNTLGSLPFSREHGTTALLYLYFRSSVATGARARLAQRLSDTQIGHRPHEFEGVTGVAPARLARTRIINDRLAWVELATIVLIAVALAIRFRAVGAPLVTVATIGVAYELADRLVAAFGRLAGVDVPAEIQPLLIVLVFGIATDYAVFFLSRGRALLADGQDRRVAAADAVRRTVPIVAVAGITVAAGTAALLAARLNFLSAFGPGLAIAVTVAMIVAVSFTPALLAMGGRHLFWPRLTAGSDHSDRPRASRMSVRVVQFAVGHPIIAAVLAAAMVGGAASGLPRIALGNDIVNGLPASSGPRRAYAEAAKGFTPGVLAPTVVVVTGSDIGYRRRALDRLQASLQVQPGVAQVLGPVQQQLTRRYGLVFAPSGGAARYVLFLDHSPLDARAIAQMQTLQSALPGLLARAGLRDAAAMVAGDTALSGETLDATISDLERVIPAVLAVIFVVLAIFLRALVAPLYLVATSALATLAALGLTVYVMQMLIGYGQLIWYLVAVVGVLLISLGSDYNVFLVGRVWQEGQKRPLRDAIAVGGSRAARPITTAALVLALSFALLVLVPVRGFREIACAMTFGLLIDAFVIRTVLVPALLALVGPASAWPGHAIKGARASRSRHG